MSTAVIGRTAGGFLCLLLFVGSNSAAGEILKCVDAEGKVTFSDTGCPEAAAEQPQGQRKATPASDGHSGASQPAATTGKRQGYGGYIDRSRAAESGIRPPEGQ